LVWVLSMFLSQILIQLLDNMIQITVRLNQIPREYTFNQKVEDKWDKLKQAQLQEITQTWTYRYQISNQMYMLILNTRILRVKVLLQVNITQMIKSWAPDRDLLILLSRNQWCKCMTLTFLHTNHYSQLSQLRKKDLWNLIVNNQSYQRLQRFQKYLKLQRTNKARENWIKQVWINIYKLEIKSKASSLK
jgi:hypothetical protein